MYLGLESVDEINESSCIYIHNDSEMIYVSLAEHFFRKTRMLENGGGTTHMDNLHPLHMHYVHCFPVFDFFGKLVWNFSFTKLGHRGRFTIEIRAFIRKANHNKCQDTYSSFTRLS